MERERDFLSAIVEQSGDGIVVVDDKGVVRLVNAEAQRQGASEPAGPLATPSRAALGADAEPLPQEDLPLSRALRGEGASATVLVRPREGRLRRLIARASPLRGPDGSVRGAVV